LKPGLISPGHASSADTRSRPPKPEPAPNGGPDGLRAATIEQLLATTKPLAPRMATRLVEAVKAALDAQTVTVPGTSAASTVLPHPAQLSQIGP
jgi:hypothetical protein